MGGPSSERHAVVIVPTQTAAESESARTFSLATTRISTVKQAGQMAVHFRIASLRMDANTNCSLYNVTFSAIFTP
jgi:hypothetical protein